MIGSAVAMQRRMIMQFLHMDVESQHTGYLIRAMICYRMLRLLLLLAI